MKRTKLLVLLCIFAVAMLAFLAGAAAEMSDSTDDLEVVSDIVDSVPAAPVMSFQGEEADVTYNDDVGTLVLMCFVPPAPTRTSKHEITLLTCNSVESEGNPEPNTIRLWRNTCSTSSPIHRWIRA